MRRRELLITIALLTIALVSAEANPAAVSKSASRGEQIPASDVDIRTDAEVSPTEMLSVEASPLISKDETLAVAYFNTLSILSTTNECSVFFGGPAASVEVFKQLISKMTKDSLTTPVGIQMSGETINVSNAVTKTQYRLFDKVRINANGPFYRRLFSSSNVPLPRIGTFEPNTKEVRVLMFLHELGHVMKGEDGNWLLPNDGKDEILSRQNSQKINDVCGTQIKALRNREGEDDAQTTLAGTTDNAAPKKREAGPATDN
jgi:hypothetical protein